MALPKEAFDPYLKWLGIRPKDQPAHHYRLLGLDAFESDPDVIANAADARMAHIKTFQAGVNSALSQRILNELAAAKVCLLNAEKKASYDAALRVQLQAAAPAPPVAPPPAPVAVPREEDFNAIVAYRPPARAAGRSHRSAVPPYLWIVGGFLAALAVAAIVLVNSQDNAPIAERPARTESSPTTAVKEPAKPPVPEKPADGGPQATVAAKTNPAKTKPAKIEPKAAPQQPGDLGKALREGKIDPAPAPIGPQPVASPSSPPGVPDSPPAAPSPPVKEKPAEPAPAAPSEVAAGRRPVPDAATRAAKEKKVREVFDKDFTAAKTPQEKIFLSAKLYKAATETSDDPPGQYALFSLACDVAAAVGEVPQAMVAVDEIVKLYDFNPVEMKLRLLAKAAEGRTGAPSEPMFQLVASTALVLAEDAIANDDLATALKFSRAAVNAAKKTKNAVLQRAVADRSRELDRLRERFQAVQDALAALAKTPADPEANLAVGRWRCFAKGQWGEGLPCLAKGSNPQLAALAKQDLAGGAAPDAALALAEAWMKQADAEQEGGKAMSRARAAYWCRAAIANLSGLRKAAAEKRLDEITSAGTAAPDRPRGEVQSGNVALADNGATVNSTSGTGKELIDGNLEAWSVSGGTANAPCPSPACQWTIELDKVYRLQEIRLLLYKGDPANAYHYVIGVSADGQTFLPLVDRSYGLWTGWQRHQFPAQPVKAIRLIGLGATGRRFAAVELEAYCVPPTTLPEETKPVEVPADGKPPADSKPPHRHHKK